MPKQIPCQRNITRAQLLRLVQNLDNPEDYEALILTMEVGEWYTHLDDIFNVFVYRGFRVHSLIETLVEWHLLDKLIVPKFTKAGFYNGIEVYYRRIA